MFLQYAKDFLLLTSTKIKRAIKSSHFFPQTFVTSCLHHGAWVVSMLLRERNCSLKSKVSPLRFCFLRGGEALMIDGVGRSCSPLDAPIHLKLVYVIKLSHMT